MSDPLLSSQESSVADASSFAPLVSNREPRMVPDIALVLLSSADVVFFMKTSFSSPDAEVRAVAPASAKGESHPQGEAPGSREQSKQSNRSV